MHHLEPAGSHEFTAKRDLVIARLNKEPGNVLVFVRYGPKHNIHLEWVFNDADIDDSRIVWARSLPNGKDDELMHYFPSREAWILEDDGTTTLWPMKAGPDGAAKKNADRTARQVREWIGRRARFIVFIIGNPLAIRSKGLVQSELTGVVQRVTLAAIDSVAVEAEWMWLKRYPSQKN